MLCLHAVDYREQCLC